MASTFYFSPDGRSLISCTILKRVPSPAGATAVLGTPAWICHSYEVGEEGFPGDEPPTGNERPRIIALDGSSNICQSRKRIDAEAFDFFLDAAGQPEEFILINWEVDIVERGWNVPRRPPRPLKKLVIVNCCFEQSEERSALLDILITFSHIEELVFINVCWRGLSTIIDGTETTFVPESNADDWLLGLIKRHPHLPALKRVKLSGGETNRLILALLTASPSASALEAIDFRQANYRDTPLFEEVLKVHHEGLKELSVEFSPLHIRENSLMPPQSIMPARHAYFAKLTAATIAVHLHSPDCPHNKSRTSPVFEHNREAMSSLINTARTIRNNSPVETLHYEFITDCNLCGNANLGAQGLKGMGFSFTALLGIFAFGQPQQSLKRVFFSRRRPDGLGMTCNNAQALLNDLYETVHANVANYPDFDFPDVYVCRAGEERCRIFKAHSSKLWKLFK